MLKMYTRAFFFNTKGDQILYEIPVIGFISMKGYIICDTCTVLFFNLYMYSLRIKNPSLILDIRNVMFQMMMTKS